MAVIDLIILGVLAVSTLISLWRGFIREALSLVIWVAAFLVARMFSGNLAILLGGLVETNSLRWLLSFAILFLGTVVVGTMLNFLISKFIHATGLAGLDRTLGMVFGFVRGLVILVAVVYGLKFTVAVQDDWWQQSIFIPFLSTLADWAQKTLPGAAGQFYQIFN
ncbi:MAG: CvpA family protein [Venatoribacter sp.]